VLLLHLTFNFFDLFVQFCFFFFAVLGLELKALHLLDKQVITWCMPLALFALFSGRISWILPRAGPGPPSSYLYLLCSWDYRNELWCSPCLLRWVFQTLPRLASHSNPPSLHISSRRNYRCVPPWLAFVGLPFICLWDSFSLYGRFVVSLSQPHKCRACSQLSF
jgi:hypothetical protein